MNHRLIYLASPYNHENKDVRVDRANQAAGACSWLMQRGHVVYSPIVHNHAIACLYELPTGWDYWGRFDTVMLSRCDEIVVLRIPGWQESKGISAELKIA